MSLLFRLQPLSLNQRVRLLTAALERGGWQKRDSLARRLDWSVRVVRDTASHSAGQILSGPRGLCLTVNALPKDAERAVAILRSQAAEMIRRSAEIEKVRHGPLRQIPLESTKSGQGDTNGKPVRA